MKFKNWLIIIFSLLYLTKPAIGQSNFEWPESKASTVFQNFLKAYNSGDDKAIENFVAENYKKTDPEYIYEKVNGWMDLFYRFGEIKPKNITINEAFDLEIWLQGKLTKAWFAVEFILDVQTSKVKAVGILQGTLPEGAAIGCNDEKEMLKVFEKYLQLNEKEGLFQGSVLLQKGEKILIDQGYGYKSYGDKTKNDKGTRFDIWSITKTITAVACLQLVQQGLIDIDASIDTYLPELPTHIASQITIRMLLNHTSGYELDGINGFREALEKTNSLQEVYQLHLQYLSKWKYFEDFKPTRKYDYTNDAFDLLGVIIEHVSEMNFEDYLEAFLFNRLGMFSTSFKPNDIASKYRYDLSVKGLKDFSVYYPYQMGKISGAGGLFSTTNDLRRFFNALLRTSLLLDYPTKSLLFSPHVRESEATNVNHARFSLKKNEDSPVLYNGYGLGLMISYDAQLNFGHSGTGIGNSSELRYFPESDYLLIVLCNNRSGAKNVYNFFKNILPRD